MRGELLEAERVHSTGGGFFAVSNYYGYGLSERVYAGALEHELRDRVTKSFASGRREQSGGKTIPGRPNAADQLPESDVVLAGACRRSDDSIRSHWADSCSTGWSVIRRDEMKTARELP